jgi:flagellar export protein FliJ
MPFRFSLATVLRIRESLEKREERALQKIQLEMAHVLRQIEELNAEIAKSHEMREQEMAQLIPASHLHMLLWQVQAAGEKRVTLFQNLLALEHQRDQQIKVYQQAHRDRETLTDMSNQQRDLYEQEQARGEQKSLDDIFMARRHRS